MEEGGGGSGGSHEGEIGQSLFHLKSLNLAQTLEAVQFFFFLFHYLQLRIPKPLSR